MELAPGSGEEHGEGSGGQQTGVKREARFHHGEPGGTAVQGMGDEVKKESRSQETGDRS